MQVSHGVDTKYRWKKLFRELRKELGPVLRELAKQKGSEIIEEKFLIDHVHILVTIPPKYTVSKVSGYIKGKSAIHIARNYGDRRKNFTDEHFWARGYFVSTVDMDVGVIQQYICQQEDRGLTNRPTTFV